MQITRHRKHHAGDSDGGPDKPLNDARFQHRDFRFKLADLHMNFAEIDCGFFTEGHYLDFGGVGVPRFLSELLDEVYELVIHDGLDAYFIIRRARVQVKLNAYRA
jgi:hypothetical protein